MFRLVLILFSAYAVTAYGHGSKETLVPPKPADCTSELQNPAYKNKTIILDANVIMNDPHALSRFPGAKIIITSVLLDELDNNKGHDKPVIGAQVRQFVRQMIYLLREKGASGDGKAEMASIQLDDGTQVVLDPNNYVKALSGMGYERRKADNSGYLAPALAYKQKGEDVLLITDDLMMEIKAASLGIAVESFKSRPETLLPADAGDEMKVFEITDAEMQALLSTNTLPMPAGLELNPNEFIQFFSPSHPASHENIARYVFERPVPVFEATHLTETMILDGEFRLTGVPFEGTVRVFLNSDPVPEVGPGQESGWYYDSSENKVVFIGEYKQRLYRQSHVVVEGQITPHHMKRLLSFDELGLWNLQSRSLEQTMAVNLAMELGSGIDCLIQEGIAGTSKTFNTTVAASRLLELGTFKQVIITRSPTPMGGHSSGYLPGDSDEKNMPWMEPYLDNISAVEAARGGKVKPGKRHLPNDWSILDYGYIRGRSLKSTLISVDEAQNMGDLESEAVLTRISTGSAFVIMGDITQVDPPMTIRNNGLTHLINLVTDPALSAEHRSRVAVVRLKKSVRHPFARMIAELALKRRQGKPNN